ncbi:MAG: extracellular solute-binding protein, partial [Oscillospiraceae bacterium]|nr:extracellular solute-binding protein [Oscillospiraceae bacterium]
MKKIIFVILAILCLCLLSCMDEDKTSAKDENPGNPAAEDAKIELVGAIGDNLPEINYGGRSFRIVCDEGTLAPGDFIAETINGDLLNDAVYNRNLVVEERFGVTIDARINGYGTGFTQNLKVSILAGDDMCEAAMGMYNTHSGITAMMYDRNFIAWDNLPYVDLSKPWWDKNVIRDISFTDTVYCMTGDLNPSTLGNTRIIIFNKNLFQDLGIGFPYQKVLDGKWTYDEFFRICAQGEADLNGDGLINYKDDRFGYVGWHCDQPESMFYGLGGAYTIKDRDGLPVFDLNNEKSSNIIDKMVELFTPGNGGWTNTVGWGVDLDMFSEGRALMANSRFWLLNAAFRGMEDDFGILPHPMLDGSQGGYRQSVDGVCTMAYIPITNNDLEFTSVILEAV